MYGDIEIGEAAIDFFPLEDDLISLELPGAFRQVRTPFSCVSLPFLAVFVALLISRSTRPNLLNCFLRFGNSQASIEGDTSPHFYLARALDRLQVGALLCSFFFLMVF